MRVEDPRYFTQNDLEPHLSLPPDCDWQTMIARQEVLAPGVLAVVLGEAKDFLVTQPGPNLARRQQLVPLWFNYWQKRLRGVGQALSKESRLNYVHSKKLMPFDQVADFLKRNQLTQSSGVLFVAGAEGHEGHIYAANYMALHVKCPIWVFEQPGYLERKARKAPFLPLAVRLSMWERSVVRVLTVSPERANGMPEVDHYQSLFKRLGVAHCFADSSDPNCWEKVRRGDLADFLIMPHLNEVERTTERVQQLMEDPCPGPDRLSDDNLVQLRLLLYFSGYFQATSFWEI